MLIPATPPSKSEDELCLDRNLVFAEEMMPTLRENFLDKGSSKSVSLPEPSLRAVGGPLSRPRGAVAKATGCERCCNIPSVILQKVLNASLPSL